MKVRDIMQRSVKTCRPQDSLLEAGRLMRDCHCGVLPIIGEQNKIEGILTDRDICLRLTEFDERPSGVRVSEIMKKDVYSCRPDDSTDDALEVMRENQVRRLPILDEQRRLIGILSMDDIICETAKSGDRSEVQRSYKEVVDTLENIHSHQAA